MRLRTPLLALLAVLATMAVGGSAATAAVPAGGDYTTRAAGQLTPYVLIGVNGRHKITLISLAKVRCMSGNGRLDMMLGIRQRRGSFSITRRSGIFHVTTGKLLLGRDERVQGRFTSPGTATGSARVISIPRLGARPCDSGWVRFRVIRMDPIEGVASFPSGTSLVLPATAIEQIRIVNRSSAPSKANRVALDLRARTKGSAPLESAPMTTVSPAQGNCSTPRWQTPRGDTTSQQLQTLITCELGPLRGGQQTTLTVSASFALPSSCAEGIGIGFSVGATIERASLNESRPLPVDDRAGSYTGEFDFDCPRVNQSG